MRRAVCPGSFDPITLGHLDVIRRAAGLFDEVIVAVGINTAKVPLLDVQQRVDLVREVTEPIAGVSVQAFDGLLAPWAAHLGACAIVRGVRSGLNWDAEEPQGQLNQYLGGPETVYLAAGPKVRHISSSLVREIARLGGDISGLVPDAVAVAVRARTATAR